jgi:hypothetical protein
MQPQFNWKLISSTGYAPPDEGWLEQAWGAVTGGIVTIVDGATTFANAVLDTVGSLLGPVLDAFATLLRLLFSIPYLGGGLSFIWNLILTVVWGIASILDFILALLGILPEKRMKLLVVIQRQENGGSVATVEEALLLLQAAIDTYKDQANVRILPAGYFKYASAFQDTPTASNPYVMTEANMSASDTLDVCCGGCAFGDNFKTVGPSFQQKMTLDCFGGNASALIGYGAPVCAFAVRKFTDEDDPGWGCSLGPIVDYVTVDVHDAAVAGANAGDPHAFGSALSLAHEVGHACNLTHQDAAFLPWGGDVSDGNLMHHKPTHRGPSLTRWQVATLRTSRHVTYLDLPF